MADQSRARRIAGKVKNLGRTQFTCTCSPGRDFRGHKALNAHHLSRHGSYWAGAKAKGVGRKMGKTQDQLRKHARGWLEAHGHVDGYGNRTGKARSRPQARGHLSTRHLASQARHGRDHDRADKLTRKAAGNTARDRHGPAERLHRAAAATRAKWPARQPRATRPAPARTAPAKTPEPARAKAPKASSNGHRPAPARPLGRLAPSRPAVRPPARTSR